MSFAINTKPYSCWDCHYFKAMDPENSPHGYCRRYAPHSLSLYGFDSVVGGTSPLIQKGDLYTRDAAMDTRLPVGTDGQVLKANAATATGLEWDDPPQVPLTTKGDILTNDGTENVRLPVGTDGQVLKANSATSEGVEWADSAESPLTTKGDLYTHNVTDDTRLPLGTDGQILVVNNEQATGMEWIEPPYASSPLTSKGDIWGHNGINDSRIAVGTDGQILYADPTQANGVRWDAAPIPGGIFVESDQAARFGEVQAVDAEMTRDGEAPGGAVRPISSTTTSYDNAGSFPFMVPLTSQIDAVQISVTKTATSTATVGAAPTLEVTFWEVSGPTEVQIGSAFVPIDPATVSPNFNTGTPDWRMIPYVLPVPIPISSYGQYGWRLEMTPTGSDEKICKTRNVNVRVYRSYTPPAATLAEIAEARAAFDANRVDIMTAIMGSEAQALAADITPDQSINKWSFIQFAPNVWCGEYKRNSGNIPAIPPFELPTGD